MNLIITGIKIIWLGRIILNGLSYINLWRIKEYRLDRMLIHLQAIKIWQLFLIPLRRPPPGIKTILLLFLYTISLGILNLLFNQAGFIILLYLDLLSFPLISFWVLVLNVPTFLYHRLIIYLASQKLLQHKFKYIIGITGSYGKTSTKEFLASILSQKYKVLKTSGSQNSPIGIAERVVYDLKKEHEIFIVEMGAYKPGEIAEMALLVKPQIGIITAVNAQHQDLFKTIENTVRAKYELIENLTKEKIAIFNASNQYTLQMSERAKQEGKTVWLYSRKLRQFPPYADKNLAAQNITVKRDGLEFDLWQNNTKFRLKVDLLGSHQTENLLAAILAAEACGLSFKEAVNLARKVKSVPQTMQKIPGIKRAVFIDDTFNNNPDAMMAALEYLRLLSGRKILVFQPFIELGNYAKNAHREIGKKIGEICDEIYITNPNNKLEILEGLKSVKSMIKVWQLSTNNAAKRINDTISKSDTVLFKGREAESVLKLIKN